MADVDTLDIPTPIYYVLGRDIKESDLPAIHAVLEFTPIMCAIVQNPYHRVTDIQLAKKFTRDVVSLNGEWIEAQMTAEECHDATHFAPLLVGDGASLTAYYDHNLTQEIYPSC
jgi:hypothetical protein